jgi:hypothetical protein
MAMRTIEKITEEEMVAVFLQTEINSSRFSASILRILERDNVDRKIIDCPDINDKAENDYRAALMGEFRGYKRNKEIFVDFPDDIQWERIVLNRQDLEKIKYINWDYWLEISDNTRLATEAARKIRLGMIDGEEAKGFWSVSDALRKGLKLPELILVSKSKEDNLVLLEGHVRLTGYLLKPEYLPPELSAIVGCSERMDEWELY